MLTIDRMEKARAAPDYDERLMILTHINAIQSLKYLCKRIRETSERMTTGNMAHHKASQQIDAQTIRNYLELMEQDLKQLSGVYNGNGD